MNGAIRLPFSRVGADCLDPAFDARSNDCLVRARVRVETSGRSSANPAVTQGVPAAFDQESPSGDQNLRL